MTYIRSYTIYICNFMYHFNKHRKLFGNSLVLYLFLLEGFSKSLNLFGKYVYVPVLAVKNHF